MPMTDRRTLLQAAAALPLATAMGNVALAEGPAPAPTMQAAPAKDVTRALAHYLVTAGTDLESVVREVLSRMHTEQYEIVTLYYGADITQDAANLMAQRIKEQFPGQEVEVVDGGQPFYAYIISAE